MTDEPTNTPHPETPEDVWATLPLEERRTRVSASLAESLFAYEREHPRWTMEVLLDILRRALRTLRVYVEDARDPAISWDEPFVELRFAVDWDFEQMRPPDFPMPDEALRTKGSTSAWLSTRFMDLMETGVLKLVTKGAGVRVKGEETESLVAPEVQAALEKMTEEEKEVFFRDFGKPFVLGADYLEEEEDLEEGPEDEPRNLTPAGETRLEELEPFLPFSGEDDGGPFSGSIVFAVHPLAVNEDTREAFYPVVVGLHFNPREEEVEDPEDVTFPDPTRWTSEEIKAFWTTLDDGMRKLAAFVSEKDLVAEGLAPTVEVSGTVSATSSASATAETDTRSTTDTMEVFRALDVTEARIVAPTPERISFLVDSPTRVSKEALLFVGKTPRLSLPRKWGSIARWEDLVEKEKTRLLDTMGEDAFDRRPGYPPRLDRRYDPRAKTDVVVLTSAGVRDLEDTEGPRGFRRVETEGGRRKEYLVKILPLRDGSGRATFKTSWFGETWALSEDAREDARRRLEEMKKEGQGELFEDLPAHVQEEIDSRLRHLEHVRDALPLAEHIIRKFGGEGRNPVHFRASELWDTVLRCGDSTDRLARVRGALRALRELDYGLELEEKGHRLSFEGSFLSAIAFYSKGKEDHADGDFYLSISLPFIGGLRVFEIPGRSLRDVREITLFDFGKKLDKEERKKLKGYHRGATRLAVILFKAHGFTKSQEALFRFLEGQRTRKSDPISKHRRVGKAKKTAKDAHEPRLYDRAFCPLIPEGKLYGAALGAFRRSPEAGWTLYGTPTGATRTGGGHAEGLLSVMGHPYPPGTGSASAARKESVREALDDLRFVVEEVMGGLVAARWEKTWFSLVDAARLGDEVKVRKLKWFLFLPPDFEGRVHERIDEANAKGYEKGETSRLWRVQRTDAPTTGTTLATGSAAPEEAAGGLRSAPLWVRLTVERKKRKLSQTEAAGLFGLTRQALALWETEEDEKRKPIPGELVPLVLRWVETGTPPTAEELAARKTRRAGLPKPPA